ncbi:MAG: hypothetical protein WAU24_13405, partial [Chitinophagaceae bacterium]
HLAQVLAMGLHQRKNADAKSFPEKIYVDNMKLKYTHQKRDLLVVGISCAVVFATIFLWKKNKT